MSGLHHLSGPGPHFGGRSLAEKFGTYFERPHDTIPEPTVGKNGKRSTALEAVQANKKEHLIASIRCQRDETFLKCCEMANVKPTPRQWRKFKHGSGKAFAQLARL